MKAAVNTQYGPPHVITIGHVKKPVPGKNEILVKVIASTVNRTDCAILRAKPPIMRLFTGLLKPGNVIPGTDFAGIVEAVGKNVKYVEPGHRVFGFDDSGLSSKAGYLTISYKKAVLQMPDNISYWKAAASIEGAHYAYNFLNKIDLKKYDRVLVNGATGAIGTALVQLLNYLEADVTAVGNTKNIPLLKSLGANHVIDYHKEDFTQSTQKYSYIFDSVGKSSFSKCKDLLEKGGVYMSSELGFMGQNVFYSLFKFLTGDKRVKFPFPTKPKESLGLVRKLMKEGKYDPVIERVYKLEDIVKAYEYVESGQKTGNVLIKIF